MKTELKIGRDNKHNNVEEDKGILGLRRVNYSDSLGNSLDAFLWKHNDIEGASIMLTSLFSRERAVTTRSHFTDLFSLGMCNYGTYSVIVDYVKTIALTYYEEQKLEFFNRECFIIDDVEDVNKLLMIKGLDDEGKKYYICELGETYLGALKKYLNSSGDPDNGEEVKKVIMSLSILAKTQEINEILDKLLKFLYQVLAGNFKDTIKVNAFFVMFTLIIHVNLDAENENLIKFIIQTEKLIAEGNYDVVCNAIGIIDELTEKGLLKGVDSEVIKSLFGHAVCMLDYEAEDIIENALRTIRYIVQWKLISEVDGGTIKEICDQAIAILDEGEDELEEAVLLMLSELGEKKFLNKLDKERIACIVNLVYDQLSNDSVQLVEAAMGLFGSFAKADLLKAIKLEVFKNIINKIDEMVRVELAESFEIEEEIDLENGNEKVEKLILLHLICDFAAAELLSDIQPEIMKNINLFVQESLDHPEPHIVSIALKTLGKIVRFSVDEELYPNKDIFLKVKELLAHDENIVIMGALFALNDFVSANFFENVDSNIISDITIKVENFQEDMQKEISDAANELLIKFRQWKECLKEKSKQDL